MHTGDESPIPDPLLRALDKGRVAPFLGAGCSAEAPANLPTASELAGILAAAVGEQESSLEEIAGRIWSEGGWQEFARALPIADWRARPPNESHRVLAELCKEGCVRRVLTTNWDILVEQALSQIGQPYSVIVRAESLDTEAVSSVQVIKVHGCITYPELIKVTGADVQSEEWLDAWTSALFETTLRTHSLLCVGYSGASQAATSAVAKLVASGERTSIDVVVDRNAYADMMEKDYGRDFLTALRLESDSYLESTADSFFRQLRDAVHPVLLMYVRTESRAMLTELTRSTSVAVEPFHTSLDQVADLWQRGGSLLAQQWLRTTFVAGQDLEATRPYVSLRERKTEIGRCWAWIAIALWAEAGHLDPTNFSLLLSVQGHEAICVMAACPPNKRRDAVARELVLRWKADNALSAMYVGVMFDGLGPLVKEASSFSVARGVPEPTIARGGAVDFKWQDGNRLFECLVPDASPDVIRESIRAGLSSLVTWSV